MIYEHCLLSQLPFNYEQAYLWAVQKDRAGSATLGLSVEDVEIVVVPSRAVTMNGVKTASSHDGGYEPNGIQNGVHHVKAVANSKSGLSDAVATKLLNGLREMPPEIEEVAREYFVGLGTLIGRSAQDSWNGLSRVVGQLSNIHVKAVEPPRIPGTGNIAASIGTLPNTTEENLEKKEKLLNFAKEQKDIFIKLLVLLHWSKDVEGVSKVIDLNRWLRDRISRYGEVATDIARMKRYLAFIQIPNPDLKTAAEVLSGETVTGFSDLGYIPAKPITNKQALKTLRSLNSLLCTRLTLHEDLPDQLRKYKIQDGRVTFYVADEFELDVSVLDENIESQFFLADFRFAFSPAVDFPNGRLFDELALAANDVLGKTGLFGCYEFLHEFTLSYKINVLFKEALELLQGQWSDNLRVEMIHRTLVVQYWTNRQESKSWIEVGIQSGRKRKVGQSYTDTSLGVRWIHAGKEVEDANVELDVQHLSVDTLLRQVVAQHTNRMFNTVYDSLMTVPLYREKDLVLEQSASSIEPSQCNIKLELAKGRLLEVALETVTGAIVITPTSGLCNQVEADLNRARNMVEELPRRLSYLRVKTAEEDLISQAEATGWVVLRSFSPTAAEKVAWFGAQVQRSMFLRCPHWESGHMLVATHSPQGDEWWLLTKERAEEWSSQKLRIDSRHKETRPSHTYMRSLQDYCSGVIVLQQNARWLNTLSIRCALGSIPPMGTKFELPQITMDFQPAKLDPILKPEWLSTDWKHDDLRLSQAKKDSRPAYIRKVITVKYLGQSLSSGATLELIGSTECSQVDENILAYLRQKIDDSAIAFRPDEEKFSIKITHTIGKPAIEELLRRLLHLETIMACAKAVCDSPSIEITALSKSDIALQYQSGTTGELGLAIKFATASRPLSLEFTPKGGNPHELIRKPLVELLSHSRQSFSDALMSALPLLSGTYPLMSLFRELQSEKWYDALGLGTDPNEAHVLPRIHIMARHTTMFGVQLYAPAGFTAPGPLSPHRATGMLARFEMLLLTRRGKAKWLLRPAIEEFDSYSQLSYCAPALREKIVQEIFKTTEPKGWQAMDSGAACDLNDPKPLLHATLGVVVAWMKSTREDAEVPTRRVEQTAQPGKAQKPKQGKAPQKGPQEVIQLD